MNRGVSMLLLLLVVAVLLVATSASLSSRPLVPAFAWSNHRNLDSHLPGAISYQTLSSEDFVAKVKDLLEWEQREDFDVEVVIVFIGTQLRSGDVSGAAAGPSRPPILQVLDRVVMGSNSSVSLPYVTLPGDGASVADALVKGIVKDSGSVLGEVLTTGACVNKDMPGMKRLSFSVLQEYLPTRTTTRTVGKTDLVVVCGSSEVDNSERSSMSLSEGATLDEVLSGLDARRTRYVALYTSDLSGELALPSRPRGRQLGSVVYEGEEYCNVVCQTKAMVLEGLLVGLTLIIILISGLCCMAGITTPSRFEQNKEGQ